MSSFKLEFSSSTEGIVKNDLIKCFGDDAHLISVLISKIIESNITRNSDTLKTLVKDFLKRYQSTSSTPSKKKMKLICWTALVHILKLCSPSYEEVRIHSIEELRATYPTIINKLNDAKELGLFLEYCNSLRMALRVLSAKNNKKLLIDISSRLEGLSSKTYITGSGQTNATTRRVEVYEQEGGELPIPRFPKKSRPNVEQDESGEVLSPKRPRQKKGGEVSNQKISRPKKDPINNASDGVITSPNCDYYPLLSSSSHSHYLPSLAVNAGELPLDCDNHHYNIPFVAGFVPDDFLPPNLHLDGPLFTLAADRATILNPLAEDCFDKTSSSAIENGLTFEDCSAYLDVIIDEDFFFAEDFLKDSGNNM